MPPKGLVICLALITSAFIVGGALWTLDPERFVRVYRRIAIGDYYAKRPKWEQGGASSEGRVAGCVLLCFGLGGLYLLLKLMRVF